MERNTAADFDPALNMARQALYRFAALLFDDPDHGAWERLEKLRNVQLLEDAATLLRGLPNAEPAALARGERPIADLQPLHVLERLPRSSDALTKQYEQVFGLVVAGNCPLYETEYINSRYAFLRSNTLADISGFYRAFGLTISKQNRERPDHLMLELEFMASLLGLEQQAAGGDCKYRNERLIICRDAQMRFFKDHLAWWIPPFTWLLIQAHEETFYEAAAKFLASWIAAERAMLNVEVRSHVVPPDPADYQPMCDGCQMLS